MAGLRISASARTAAGLCACVLVLAGCGNKAEEVAEDPDLGGTVSPTESSESGDPSPTPEDPANNLPDCADLWTDGRTLSEAYDGCADGDALVPVDKLSCSSGQFIVTYADRYYATLGGEVTDTGEEGLRKSKEYRDDVIKCRG